MSVGQNRRNRSIDHEATWLNVAGYSLRPGFGHSSDIDFIDDVWPMFRHGPAFPKESRSQIQWLIFWRRLAGGLNNQQQEEIFDKIWPSLRTGNTCSQEDYLLAGSLERLSADKKINLGNLLVRQLLEGEKNALDSRIWCLARVASRHPLYSEISYVLRPAPVNDWIKQISQASFDRNRYKKLSLFFSWAARMVHDREFDITNSMRDIAIAKLEELGAEETLTHPVRNFVPFETGDKSQMFGEKLPVGLQII